MVEDERKRKRIITHMWVLGCWPQIAEEIEEEDEKTQRERRLQIRVEGNMRDEEEGKVRDEEEGIGKRGKRKLERREGA